MPETLSITPLTRDFASVVGGMDLAAPLSAATQSALNRALRDRGVLLFRDQTLTPEGFLAACRIFGSPTEQNYNRTALDGMPEIAVLSSARSETDERGKRLLFGTEAWHVDHINLPNPPKATVLHALRLPARGGDTSFADSRAAYDRLSDAERKRLDGLRTVNGRDRHLPRHAEDSAHFAALTEHPLVRTHPLTGRKAIYCHPMKLDHLIGPEGPWSQVDSWAFIDALLDKALQPDLIYRHRWQRGDFAVLDNRSCLHLAHADYDPDDDRVMYRAILAGERPV